MTSQRAPSNDFRLFAKEVKLKLVTELQVNYTNSNS